MMQDDQYNDKRLMWAKDNSPEHIMHRNHQMIPYEMAQRHHQLAITDLSNNTMDVKTGGSDMDHMHMAEMGKKKRGRPKKVRGEGEEVVKKPTVKRPKPPMPADFNGEIPQKKRGRPKKGMSDGTEAPQRPPKTPQPYNGNDPQKKKRGRPKKSKGDKDDNSMLPSNDMSQGAVNDARASNEYMTSIYSQTAPVHTCSSLPPHQSLRQYDQQPPSNKFNIGGNYFGIGGTPNTQLNNSSGNYSQQNYHSQHQYTHSELSSELSAAITADHLGNTDDVNSPSSASPNLGTTNFEQQQSSGLLSGSSTPPNRMPHQMQQSNSNVCYSPYRHTPPSNEYMQHNMQSIPGTPTHTRHSAHNDVMNDNFLPSGSSQLNNHPMGGESYGQVPHHQQHPYHHHQVPAAMQRQPPGGPLGEIYAQKMMNTTDVTAKSLSGLESLVDQIPSLSSYSTDTGNASNAIDEQSLNDIRNVLDNPMNELGQMPGSGGGGGSGSSGGAVTGGDEPAQQQDSQSQFDNCVYSADYSPAGSAGNMGCPIIGGNSPDIGGNNSRSRSSEGAGASTPNSNMSIAHQASNVNYSPSPMSMRPTSANASPSAHTPPANNASSYSPFSVSSLTGTGGNSYTPTGSPTPSAVTMNSYHPHNLMTAAIQNSLSTAPALYMEPSHLPMAVNPLYHHPHHAYSQHPSSYSAGGYGSMAHLQYQQQQQQLAQEQSLPGAGMSTIHMPSPNYPYGYATNSQAMGYHQQAAAAAAAANHHHPSHPAGYLAGHHSMFDRL